MAKNKGTGPRVDLVGYKFHRLTVTSLYGKDHKSRYKWNCECECGTERIVYQTHLKTGKTKSCGCYNAELAEARGRKYSKEDSVYRVLIKNYKKTAKLREFDFDLSFEDFKRVGSQSCFYCGTEPRIRDVKKIKNTTPVPFNGIDRVDSLLGYTIANTVGCCSNCNYMKRSLDVNEFRQHIFEICLNNLEEFEKYKEVSNG